MAKPALKLKQKKDIDLRAFAQAIVNAITDNAHFPGPDPALAALAAAATGYSDALADLRVKEAAYQAAVNRKGEARKALEAALTAMAAQVETVSQGRAEVILSAGMNVKGGNTRLRRLEAPGDLRAKPSSFEGEIIIDCDPVHGARIYEVEFKSRAEGGDWQRGGMVTKSKARISNLVPGALYTFRMRAVGAPGHGPWSDEAVCRAP